MQTLLDRFDKKTPHYPNRLLIYNQVDQTLVRWIG